VSVNIGMHRDLNTSASLCSTFSTKLPSMMSGFIV